MQNLIAIIDDEPDILELVSIHLKKSHFKVAPFLSGKEFFEFLSKETPELIILDLMLPDIDGFDICKKLKQSDEYSNIPIIMLTARAEETDKVLGLELGADDYVVKPFSPRELIARIKAILRRGAIFEKGERINIGDRIEIDPKSYRVLLDGRPLSLTPTEFNILKILASKKGWVFTREQLLDALWGNEKAVLDRTIDVHIRNLRKKLGDAGEFIKNIRGVGYKIDEHL